MADRIYLATLADNRGNKFEFWAYNDSIESAGAHARQCARDFTQGTLAVKSVKRREPPPGTELGVFILKGELK